MTNKQKKRAAWLLSGVLLAVAIVCFALMALNDNVQLYYTPQELVTTVPPAAQKVRLGGLVLPGSWQRQPHSLAGQFQLTDGLATVTVAYHSILPDLFREGQGVIVMGYYQSDNVFQAVEVLTKHDERYVPKELKHTLGEQTHAP